MANCTLFVLSSRHEGLPGVLIQAMACGAPVISTDCPSGPSEIITVGEDGILVNVDDVGGMAKQIEYLLDNPELRQTFSENASQSAQRFRVELVLGNYVAALRG
jgi:glycosyltransferase involved in cell wall biosynthesis